MKLFQDKVLQAIRKLFTFELSRIVVMLVCFPGLRNFFRNLFRFVPQSKLIHFIIGHLKTVIEKRRHDKEVQF